MALAHRQVGRALGAAFVDQVEQVDEGIVPLRTASLLVARARITGSASPTLPVMREAISSLSA